MLLASVDVDIVMCVLYHMKSSGRLSKLIMKWNGIISFADYLKFFFLEMLIQEVTSFNIINNNYEPIRKLSSIRI